MTGRLIDDAPRLSFGGHESFPFRLGWIRKGVTAARGDGLVFGAADAVVRLGVGKNMVRSIRTWCLATRMLDETPPSGASRLRPLVPTPLANFVFSEEGDPYLEDPGSLWLLHWLLVTNPDRLSFWRIAFMDAPENEFSKSDLIQLAVRKAEGKAEPTQVERDADVFVRTYALGRSGSAEEDFSCPLTGLGLLASGGGDRYVFVVGPKRTLPASVFGYAFAQFMARAGRSECSLSDATYLSGSPGQAFRLDEDSVVGYMRVLEGQSPDRWTVDVDGPIRRVGLRAEFDPLDLLRDYYRRVAA